MSDFPVRHDWQSSEVLELFALPLNDLIYQAQTAHRAHLDTRQVQLSSLLNIKTGRCSEDCSYCSQSVRFDTPVQAEPMLSVETVVEAAKQAKAQGASRFCMGAAWRKPKSAELVQVVEMVKAVKELGMETCVTLGMLEAEQAEQLQQAGLDYYNHNLDTSAEFYPEIVTTHTYQERLDTLQHVRKVGLKVCAGGIIGMGESRTDRAKLLCQLALIPIAGTPLAEAEKTDDFEFVRCIAVARIMMPASDVRLSAGRAQMSDALQALCLLAGANSIFYGERLLTADNPDAQADRNLLDRLGLQAA